MSVGRSAKSTRSQAFDHVSRARRASHARSLLRGISNSLQQAAAARLSLARELQLLTWHLLWVLAP